MSLKKKGNLIRNLNFSVDLVARMKLWKISLHRQKSQYTKYCLLKKFTENKAIQAFCLKKKILFSVAGIVHKVSQSFFLNKHLVTYYLLSCLL